MREPQNPTAAPEPVPAALPEPDLSAYRRLERFLLVAFFVSGMTGLIFEVIWTRQLVLVFGSTSLAVSSVLAAYMAGLGLGGVFGGRLAQRITRPLLAYGVLEGAIAIYGFLVPFLVPALTPLYRALYLTYAPHFLAFSLIRFAAVFVVLVIPTTLMGATLPVLTRAVEGRTAQSVVSASKLYASNTSGAVVGTVLAGFVLMGHIGTFKSNLVAVAVGLLLSAGVLQMGRQIALAPPAPRPDAAPARRLPWRSLLILLAFGLSGLTSMINEVVWTRALVMGFGPSTYAFSVMLAAFLLGIALGGAAGARALRKVQRIWLWFGIIEVFAAAATVLALVGFEPVLALYRGLADAGPGGRGPIALGFKAASAILLLLPGSLCFGASFPLAAAAYSEGDDKLSARMGELYGGNTLGCIIGSLAAGFLMIPRIGLESSLLVAAGINLAVGVVLLLNETRVSATLRVAALGATSILALAMVSHPPRWDATFLATSYRSGPGKPTETLFSQPGYNATISVTLHRDLNPPQLALRTDGKPDGSDVGDLPTQIQIGLVPMLFHPDPRDTLVVGFATGTTCGSILKDARVKRMDVLEIEAAMLDASHLFDHMNGRPLEDPRTHVIETDARNFYRATDQRYDVIVSEPSNPWMSGPSHLFSREAFTEAHGLLKPGGVMAQWVQGYMISPSTLGSILRSFSQVFPHVRVVQITDQNDLMILGSDQELPLEVGTLSQRFAPMWAELNRGGLSDAWDLLSELVGDERSITTLVGELEPSTDDNNLVEFRAPLDRDASSELVPWLASRYPGPYAELAKAGVPSDELAGRLGFRMGENLSPELIAALEAHLAQAGDAQSADQLDALWHWRAPRQEPKTAWQVLLERQRRWMMGLPQPERFGAAPEPAQGREALFSQLVSPQAKPIAWEQVRDLELAPVAAAAAARRGDCGPVQAMRFTRKNLIALRPLDPRSAPETSWGEAFASANAREVAEALQRCGMDADTTPWQALGAQERSSLAHFFLARTPPDVDAALVAAPNDLTALRLVAAGACAAGDVAGEVKALTEVVQRQGFWTPQAARLAFLTRDRPADDGLRRMLANAALYGPRDQQRELESCPK